MEWDKDILAKHGPTLQLEQHRQLSGQRCPICPQGYQSPCHWVDKCQCVLTIPYVSERDSRNGGLKSYYLEMPCTCKGVKRHIIIRHCCLQDINTSTDIIVINMTSDPAVFYNTGWLTLAKQNKNKRRINHRGSDWLW